MKLNMTLLNLIIAVQDKRKFLVSHRLLTRTEDIDWYLETRKYFFNIEEQIIKKAGIIPNLQTFEKILSCKLPEGCEEVEYHELNKFEVNI